MPRKKPHPPLRRRIGGIPSAPRRKLPPWAIAVRDLRHEAGMTQVEFANDLGCTVKSLSDWENGKTRPSRLAERAMMGTAAERRVHLDMEAGIVTRLGVTI